MANKVSLSNSDLQSELERLREELSLINQKITHLSRWTDSAAGWINRLAKAVDSVDNAQLQNIQKLDRAVLAVDNKNRADTLTDIMKLRRLIVEETSKLKNDLLKIEQSIESSQISS